MADAWKVAAEEILGELQAKVTARDLAGLLEFFEDPAVLIGTAGDGRTSDARREYLTAVTTQSAALRWDWQETVPFYESEDALGFAAFGDVVLTDGDLGVARPDPRNSPRRPSERRLATPAVPRLNPASAFLSRLDREASPLRDRAPGAGTVG